MWVYSPEVPEPPTSDADRVPELTYPVDSSERGGFEGSEVACIAFSCRAVSSSYQFTDSCAGCLEYLPP